ncbi:sugar phosphate isomerase/epimerase [Luteolibacter flavescens]|uniref:Sugar phosphate isomerase/epimerase n=1 Tax=Luteolibacter flavescens TaxID=1859460 RepID=A0ABT3FP97_9BACT|nr:sugar phosphate isomerase/epimerase [Luteolibacter flavescens]MCW1885164.1 sugar phosphate isomerase/epimerase [Luteolibacter flavescens]
MNLCVSHIAWPPGDELEALTFLRGLGVTEIEVAPVRAFGNPLAATEREVRERAAWYRGQGFGIAAFQALLFGTEGLQLFGTEDSRKALKELLIATGRVAGWAGAGAMVFGSPKNRLRHDLPHAEAIRQAADFFREVGDACAACGTCLLIEANPEAYGADFCTRLEEAAELVDAAGSPGFALHVDAGGMAVSGEDFEPVLRQAGKLLKHVHASQPDLASFADPHPIHGPLASILTDIGYEGSVSIEMRAQADGLAAVGEAVEAVRSNYGLR